MPGQQAVQSSHAAIDFCFSHPEISKEWHTLSNYLINLSTSDESQLKILSTKLRLLGVEFSEFREPDLGNQLTALAFLSNEKTRKVTGNLPLMLKQNAQLFKNEKECVIFTT